MDNLEHTSFKEILINQLISNKEYDKTEEYLIEWEKLDKNMLGLVERWQEKRYEIYKATNNVLKLRDLAQKFILEYGDFQKYLDYKNTFDDDEKETVYQNVIRKLCEIPDKNWYISNMIMEIIIYEKDYDRLFEYVKIKPYLVKDYYKYLIPKYSREVYDFFEQLIVAGAEKANSRQHYRQVCRLIRTLIKAGGKEKAQHIISKFNEVYKKRPAFIDELRKL